MRLVARGVYRNSSKLVDAETLAELTYSLGKRKPARTLLSHFGVVLKPASINFDIPTMPFFYVSHKSVDTLMRP